MYFVILPVLTSSGGAGAYNIADAVHSAAPGGVLPRPPLTDQTDGDDVVNNNHKKISKYYVYTSTRSVLRV